MATIELFLSFSRWGLGPQLDDLAGTGMLRSGAIHGSPRSSSLTQGFCDAEGDRGWPRPGGG